MLFDHLQETEEELVGHVKAASAALAFLREVNPSEALLPGPVKDQWHQHMHALNTARVRLKQAVETLHEELNTFDEELRAAASEDKDE